MLLPWSHAWAGPAYAPRAQYWPRWHLRTYYPPTQDAIPGNDDYGALSSWAVFAYLGLYPVSPTGAFVLGAPVVADAVVSAPAGAWPFDGHAPPTLHIVARNASAAHIYVAAARVNGGAPLPAPFVTWQQLWPAGTGEATLEFDMVAEPTAWGAAALGGGAPAAV
jgi:putative alpha-1,2-mannosidase